MPLTSRKRAPVNETGTFLQIREQAAADFRVADEVGFDAGDLVGFFVNPNDTG